MRKKIALAIISVTIVLTLSTLALSGIDKKKKDDLYRQVELFADTLGIVQTDYVEDVEPKTLIYGALKGMISALDPHSQFMEPDIYNELKADTEGKFGGLGVEITVKDGLLTVVTPLEDTPAWKAGIKSNDRIVRINEELTRDMTLTEAVRKLRGKAGESVNITVLRESEKKILEFKVVRDIIKIKDIKEARILEEGVGYVRLLEFRENTSKDLDKTLDNLKKSGMDAFILDLRNNPGGLLDVAVSVAEKFIAPAKLVVSTKGRKGSQNMEFLSQENRPLLDMPMVVLINDGSASGSEIVAGCLQDYKRAIILGTKSFGKGSVQTIIPLGDGSALRLTTSIYLTPSGRQIHGKGVTPDIIVEDARVEAAENQEDEQKGPDIFDQIEKKEKKQDQEQEKERVFNYKSDNQLMHALDILKAVKIYKK